MKNYADFFGNFYFSIDNSLKSYIMKVNKHLKIALDGENHMWWIAIPLSIVLLLIAAYLAFAVFISKSAFFVKKEVTKRYSIKMKSIIFRRASAFFRSKR